MKAWRFDTKSRLVGPRLLAPWDPWDSPLSSLAVFHSFLLLIDLDLDQQIRGITIEEKEKEKRKEKSKQSFR